MLLSSVETNISSFQMTRYLHDEECSSPLAGTDAGNGDSVVGTSSRPHSSTSAELETGMSTFTVQPQIVQQPVPTRTKEIRCASFPSDNRLILQLKGSNKSRTLSNFVADIKAREYIRRFPTSHQKRVHTSCVNWQRLFSRKLEAVVLPLCLHKPPRVRIIMNHIELYTCAPFSLVYMLSGFIIASLLIGLVAPIRVTCPGSLGKRWKSEHRLFRFLLKVGKDI